MKFQKLFFTPALVLSMGLIHAAQASDPKAADIHCWIAEYSYGDLGSPYQERNQASSPAARYEHFALKVVESKNYVVEASGFNNDTVGTILTGLRIRSKENPNIGYGTGTDDAVKMITEDAQADGVNVLATCRVLEK